MLTINIHDPKIWFSTLVEQAALGRMERKVNLMLSKNQKNRAWRLLLSGNEAHRQPAQGPNRHRSSGKNPARRISE